MLSVLVKSPFSETWQFNLSFIYNVTSKISKNSLYQALKSVFQKLVNKSASKNKNFQFDLINELKMKHTKHETDTCIECVPAEHWHRFQFLESSFG